MKLSKWFRIAWVLPALAMILPGPSWAEETKPAKPAPYRYYTYINLGPFAAEENLGLLGNASWQFLMDGGFVYRLGSRVWGEAEFGVAGRDHTLVPGALPTGDDNPTLSFVWLS